MKKVSDVAVAQTEYVCDSCFGNFKFLLEVTQSDSRSSFEKVERVEFPCQGSDESLWLIREDESNPGKEKLYSLCKRKDNNIFFWIDGNRYKRYDSSGNAVILIDEGDPDDLVRVGDRFVITPGDIEPSNIDLPEDILFH